MDDLSSSHLPDDSCKDDLSSLTDSPGSEPSAIGENSEFPKMSIYSPSQEQFSIPENIGTEAQSATSLSSAVSDVQGAKQYLSESEYPVAVSSSEASTNFFSPSTSRSYSFPQPSIAAHSPLMSPSTYPGFNSQTFPAAGGSEGMMAAGAIYPNSACMNPSPYMSPYSTSKHYTWPTTPNAYGTFGMNSHELMQGGYTPPYQAGSYSQMPPRGSYPASYFPPQLTATTHAS